MSKRDRTPDARDARPSPAPRSSILSPGTLGFLSLAGIAVLLFMNVKLQNQLAKEQEAIAQLSGGMAQLGSKVDAAARAAAAAAAPQRQGPDPNRVYQVKTTGSPAEGPENAAVTIAEFSDFQ